MENTSQQALNNVARNVEALAAQHGVPGAAIEGLLRLSAKDGERYNAPKSYKNKRAQEVDVWKVQVMAAILGVKSDVLTGDATPEGGDISPDAFNVRLAAALKTFVEENDLKTYKLPKIMGTGKGKGITLKDINLALDPETGLSDENKVRVICRKLRPDYFFLHPIEVTVPDNRRRQPKVEAKPGQEKLPLTTENVETVLGAAEQKMTFPLRNEVEFVDGCGMSDAIARDALRRDWKKHVEDPQTAAAIQQGREEAKKNLGAMLARNKAALEEERKAKAAAATAEAAKTKAEKPAVKAAPAPETKKEVKPKKNSRPLLFTKVEFAQAIANVKELCAKARLRDYGLFLLAGLPLKTQSVSNMNKPSFWVESRIDRYAEIFGVSKNVILGKAPPPSCLDRNFGLIYSAHLEDIIDELGYDLNEILSIYAKMTNKKASAYKTQIKNGTMPSLDDARSITTIAGIRMVDILNWEHDWMDACGAPSWLDDAIADTTPGDCVTAPNFSANLKRICEAEEITPSNLMWAIGVTDPKKRRSLTRSKSIPPAVVNAASQALGVPPEALTGDGNVDAPLGANFGRKLAEAVQKGMEDGMMDWGLLATLAAISPAAPNAMNASKLHERVMYGNPLAKGNDSFFMGLMYAFQMPLHELFGFVPEASATDASDIPESYDLQEEDEDGADDQLLIEGIDGAGSAPAAAEATDEYLGYYLSDEEKGAEPPAPIDGKPQYTEVLVDNGRAPNGTTIQCERKFQVGNIPHKVSFSEAIKGHMLRPRPGQLPWNKARLAATAGRYLPAGLHMNEATIAAFIEDRQRPLEAEIDAVVCAFYPAAADDPEKFSKAKQSFFKVGLRTFHWQSQVPGTADYGMSPMSGAFLSLVFRKLLRESGENITSVANKIAGDGTQTGESARLLDMLWNLMVDQSPTKREIAGIAEVCGTTADKMRQLPHPSITVEELPGILAKMRPDQVDTFYNQLWLAGLVPPIP